MLVDVLAKNGVHIETLSDDHCLAMVGIWADLSEQAETANPFYAPWMFHHALRLIEGGLVEPSHALLLMAWQDGQLIGMLPLRQSRQFGRLPIAHWQSLSWRHRYLGEPIIRRGFVGRFVDLLIGWLDQTKSGAHFISLPLLDHDGPFVRALRDKAIADARPWDLIQSHQRAYFDLATADPDFDRHLQSVQSNATRKGLRAKRRKLLAQGELIHQRLTDLDDHTIWLDDFLRLEHGGWKGQQGTSLRSDPVDENFIRTMTKQALERKALVMTRTRLSSDDDSRTIATSIDVVVGDQQFALKVAHDRAFDAFSPGVLHEIENLRAFHGAGKSQPGQPRPGQPQSLDSCASPEHPVLDRLYGGTKTIDHLVIGRRGGFSKTLVSAMVETRKLAQQLRQRRLNLGKTNLGKANGPTPTGPIKKD